jgi:hypothetical protein
MDERPCLELSSDDDVGAVLWEWATTCIFSGSPLCAVYIMCLWFFCAVYRETCIAMSGGFPQRGCLEAQPRISYFVRPRGPLKHMECAKVVEIRMTTLSLHLKRRRVAQHIDISS